MNRLINATAYYCLLLFSSVTVLSSCEEKIDLHLDSGYNRLVVEGEISSQEKQHTVRLTISTSYFYSEKAPVASGAQVQIVDNYGNTFPLSEFPANSGVYLTAANVKGIPGRTYTLIISDIDVNHDGKKETYQASSVMKTAMNIDSISFSQLEDRNNISYFAIKGWGQESPTSGDFYMWKYYKNGNLESDTLKETVFTDDLIVNGNYIPGLTIFEIPAEPNDTITLETIAITKEYYDFINSLMQETVWNSGSFGGPPANIKTNVSNGGTGFFNAVDSRIIQNVIH